jgi:hypothetical protein
VGKKKVRTQKQNEKRTFKQVGIVASGPSATQEDAETLQEVCEEVIAVNDSWRLLPQCDHIWATDFRWWKYHIADISRDYEGQCWTQDVQWDQGIAPADWGIHCLKADTGAPGLATKPGYVHTGRNSGYAAINLALHLGASRILLLGYDMQLEGKRRHWFGEHPEGLEVASNYPGFMDRFQTIDPADYGIEIWNVTRRTALNHFPHKTLEEVHDIWNRAATDRDISTGIGTSKRSRSKAASKGVH